MEDPSLVVYSFISACRFFTIRSVLKLVVVSRIGHLGLLRGRQTHGIAHFGSIEAHAKVTVAGFPRDVLLFLAAQLSVVALAQRFQTILQVAVVISVRHRLF